MQNKGAALPPGTRGFLISCVNYKERLAAQEAISLLSEACANTLLSRQYCVSCLALLVSPTQLTFIPLAGQYYEKANPGYGAATAAAQAHDIAQALEDEVAELKQGERSLFRAHTTNINGLVYVSVAKDAGVFGRLVLLSVGVLFLFSNVCPVKQLQMNVSRQLRSASS